MVLVQEISHTHICGKRNIIRINYSKQLCPDLTQSKVVNLFNAKLKLFSKTENYQTFHYFTV